MIGWPQPGILVSMTTTPVAVTNAAVLPPPPFKTNRLSASFSTSGSSGCRGRGAWARRAGKMPAARRTASSAMRFMRRYYPVRDRGLGAGASRLGLGAEDWSRQSEQPPRVALEDLPPVRLGDGHRRH